MLRWLPMLKRRPGWREWSVVAVFSCLFLYLWISPPRVIYGSTGDEQQSLFYLECDWSPKTSAGAAHEIDVLIESAFQSHKTTLAKRTASLNDGAAAYRARRGRHPPPGFDVWYGKAIQYDAIIVEDFFDQIYEDLEPFWSIKPSDLQYEAPEWDHVLSVRNGRVIDYEQDRHRAKTWAEMLRMISKTLPNLDLVLNPLDEPRVVAPRKLVGAAISEASKSQQRMMQVSLPSILQQYPATEAHPVALPAPAYVQGPDVWERYHGGCPATAHTDIRGLDSEGVVSNWTSSKDICLNTELKDLHGALIRPTTFLVYQQLVPIFSSAKLSTNNDILLPPPSYYAEDSMFSVKSWFSDASGRYDWTEKNHGLVWRGKATGGTPVVHTWERFHRHRFVNMLNASNVEANSKSASLAKIPGAGLLDIPTWLADVSDVAFTGLFCDDEKATELLCQALSSNYQIAPEIKMEDQYRWKYLPDIDGNSLSGRFRAFLRSNSAPMKATIFKEWHDSRLTPWVHFIPISMSFNELWEVMAYFLGFGERPAHDEQGRMIAEAGRQWAERVLRREDMLLYMHRVMLEYARLCSEDRERLGYVADLGV